MKALPEYSPSLPQFGQPHPSCSSSSSWSRSFSSGPVPGWTAASDGNGRQQREQVISPSPVQSQTPRQFGQTSGRGSSTLRPLSSSSPNAGSVSRSPSSVTWPDSSLRNDQPHSE